MSSLAAVRLSSYSAFSKLSLKIFLLDIQISYKLFDKFIMEINVKIPHAFLGLNSIFFMAVWRRRESKTGRIVSVLRKRTWNIFTV